MAAPTRKRAPVHLVALAAVAMLGGACPGGERAQPRGERPSASTASVPAQPDQARGASLPASMPAAAGNKSASPIAAESPARAEGRHAPDAAPVRTLASALAELEAAGLGDAAAVIRGRVAQKSAKMKLTEDEARDAAGYLLACSRAVPDVARLAEIMPHSSVELCRAAAERGVREADAAAIAAYLLGFTEAMRFGNLRRLDINHSHVIGRAWADIDYSGENMTWQSQQAYWAPKGVRDFKKAEHIHAYFINAYKLPHFARIYKPAGDPADIPQPAAAE